MSLGRSFRAIHRLQSTASGHETVSVSTELLPGTFRERCVLEAVVVSCVRQIGNTVKEAIQRSGRSSE